MNPKLKRLWSETPAEISGSIVLVALLGILIVVIWSGPHPKTAFPKLVVACIGRVVAYKVFRTGRLVLDSQRIIKGRLAKAIGVVGAILALVSGYFFEIITYAKFAE